MGHRHRPNNNIKNEKFLHLSTLQFGQKSLTVWVVEIQLVVACFEDQFSPKSVSNSSSIKPFGACVHYLIHGFKITVFLSKLP